MVPELICHLLIFKISSGDRFRLFIGEVKLSGIIINRNEIEWRLALICVRYPIQHQNQGDGHPSSQTLCIVWLWTL